MINLEANSRLAKWFVWCCDHLPMTAGHDYSKDEMGIRKTGATYLNQGTTLCHLFWAMLWMPLAALGGVGFLVFMFIWYHFLMHQDFIARHPDAGAIGYFGSYFFPEIFLIGLMACGAVIIFAVIGANKTGALSLFWKYLKGIKQRVCPLVKFNSAQ